MATSYRIWFFIANNRQLSPFSIIKTQKQLCENAMLLDDLKTDLMKTEFQGMGVTKTCIEFWKLKNPVQVSDGVPNFGRLDEIAERASVDEDVSQFASTSAPPGQLHLAIYLLQHRIDPSENVCARKEKGSILSSLNESFKLTTTAMDRTPSQAAKSNDYYSFQTGDRRIFDCCCTAAHPANTVAPPIQLFNPAFAYFTAKAFDSEYRVPTRFILNVRDLVHQFGLIHTSERARRDHLKSLIENVIGFQITSASNRDLTSPDTSVLASSNGTTLYLVVGEEKNEFGDASSDPSTQATFSFLRIFCQADTQTIRLKTCCPTFIIAHAGPWFAILGGVITSKCIVQRLTDYLWIPVRSTHDDEHWSRLARIFYALKESIMQLRLWYDTTLPAVEPHDTSHPSPHPRFFPSPNAFKREGGHLTRFIYQQPLERDASCVTYLARTAEQRPADIVVKFVTRYGDEAHHFMAQAGYAPKLLYIGPVDIADDAVSYGDLRMVVMEYVEGLSFADAHQQGIVPKRFRDDLRTCIAHLHNADFVFGDLRGTNVMVTSEKLKTVAQLIDFDWAGKAGAVRYPIAISPVIQWPAGVEALGIIETKHDLASLDCLLCLCS
ncbi:hypothetical protein J3R83DRAFT_5462 [Lanmaoa asiatica]|nr:hypothetical protein J3R83DRAFT_5462 [Lanmaoa asiatica]